MSNVRTLLMWLACLCALVVACSKAFATGLSSYSTWCLAAPDTCSQTPSSVIVAKGQGTNSTYMVEVDQTTGFLPIEGSITATNPSVGATGSAVPSSATFVGGKNSGNLVGFAVDASGDLIAVGAGVAGTPAGGVVSMQGVSGGQAVPVSGTFWQATQPVSGTFWQATQPISAASLPLPTGAATAAKQPALGTAGSASTDVITVQGITSMTPLKTDGSGVTQPVSGTVTANAGTGNFTVVQPTAANLNATVTGTVAATESGTWNITNITGTVSLPTGAATSANQSTANTTLSTISGQLPASLGAKATSASMAVNIASDQTVPTSPQGRTSVLLYRLSYASTNVTTSAYVQVTASTSSAINICYVFDSSGSAIKLATGGSGSEVDQVYMAPGGNGAGYPIAIASGTRIAIEALDTNATAGQLILTCMK